MNNTPNTLTRGDFAKFGNKAGEVVAANADTVTIEMANNETVNAPAAACVKITWQGYLNYLFTK